MSPPEENIPWERILGILDQLEDMPATRVAGQLDALEDAGEPDTVMRRVRLHFMMPSAPRSLRKGMIIGGRYRIEREVGSGAMGVVYEAIQTLSGQTVALKIIHPSLVMPEMRERFLGEIRSMGKLDHPGIVRLLHADMHTDPDTGTETVFFTMDYVNGSPLDIHLREQRPDLTESIRLVRDLALAIQHAHDRGVIHRDLKPSNVIIRPDGRAMVLDFGLSRLLADQAAPGLPVAGSGTPAYMAPEQATRAASAATMDVYSLGSMLYEALTHNRLVTIPPEATRQQTLHLIQNARPAPLSLCLSQAPPALDHVLARATDPAPENRHPTAASLVRALERFLPAHLVAVEAPRWRPSTGAIVPATDWQLDRLLGRGTSGEVWLATHTALDQRRVFKFCLTEVAARSLRREARLLRRLSDGSTVLPGHIPLREASLDDPPWFIAMDYLEGAIDLPKWWDQHGGEAGIPEAARLTIVAQAALALQVAHDAGILHRDVKPSNLLITGTPQDASSIRAWLVDFGVGAIDESRRLHFLTQTRTSEDPKSSASGTLLYQAPEVKDGQPATVKSDLFSLGVILYQLLRGDLQRSLPPDWQPTIDDPLLRDDLSRCLAGEPSSRLSGASALAERLQSITQRRTAATLAAAQATARERAAYRRGITRTVAVASVIIGALVALAVVALRQKKEADISRGNLALKTATAIARDETQPGRRERGLASLAEASLAVSDPLALRSTAASIFGMADLIAQPASTKPGRIEPPLSSRFPASDKETTRALSPDGRTIAIARDVDGLSGAVDLSDTTTSGKPRTLELKGFPWMPIPEPGLLQFSPDGRHIALAGPATSKHVLVFSTSTAKLTVYIFHGHDPSAIAWHPAGRLLATGSPDGIVRIWDLAAASAFSSDELKQKDLDLPPKLDEPALDFPLVVLRGHRSSIAALTFDPKTGQLASCDDAGYLRLWSGFTPDGLVGLVAGAEARQPAARQQVSEPTLSLETRSDPSQPVAALSFAEDLLTLHLRDGSTTAFRSLPPAFPEELFVSPALSHLAWNDKGSQLCLINANDIFWVNTSPFGLVPIKPGQGSKKPIGVAFDPKVNAWSLPKATEFCHRIPQPDGTVKKIGPEKGFKIAPPTKNQGSQTLLAAAADGRCALYCGRRIQFVRAGVLEKLGDLTCETTDGIIQTVEWNPDGSLLVAAIRKSGNLLAIESWSTSADWPPVSTRLPVQTLPADSVIPSPDGKLLLLRSVQGGLSLLDPATGKSTSFDSAPLASQPFPMALSQDGMLLAAVADKDRIRLYDFPKQKLVATLASPRQTTITALAWSPAGHSFAALTEDGHLQHWDLAPWLQWLTEHHLGF